MQSQNPDRASFGGRPVIIGEVLFDVFPDGSRILGGAPFNVAWHLQAFGHEPLMITRVGRDDAGAEILESMREWGLDPNGVQQDSDRPTGVVRVDLLDGQPEYTILPNQAYDAIEASHAVAAAHRARAALLYHGTLAARSKPSLQTIVELRSEVADSVFVDVNLRDPWWQRDTVEHLLRGAAWLKLNQDELVLLLQGDLDEGGNDLEIRADRFRSSSGASTVLLTRGDLGAMVVSASQIIERQPEPADDVVDTVGAGDAFSAVWIAGQLRGWTVEATLHRALGFASEICTIRGATTRDVGLYAHVLDRWRQADC